MIKDFASPKDVIKVLNRALRKDPKAINELFKTKVTCNEKLADDESIQIGTATDDSYKLGLLGLINVIFGIDEADNYGAICAVVDKKGVIDKFDHTEKYL